jgi:hypothetical protein
MANEMSDEGGKVIAYAEHRYYFDPEFHAKVEMAVGLAIKDRRFSEEERDLATTAACYGLAMERVDLATGHVLDENDHHGEDEPEE